MRLCLSRCAAATFLACAALLTAISAKGDSYTFTLVGNANAGIFVAGNDYGDYVIQLHSFTPAQCDQNASACFQTHIAATDTTSYSTVQPTLAVAPNPIAGTGCNYAVSATQNVCVNGREFISGFTDPQGMYTNHLFEAIGQTLISVPVSGPGQIELISPNGNLFYADENAENLYVGINTDAIPTAISPEPSSLALLGTGILGVVGAARRRFKA